jgi:hypothetical protein
LKAVAVVVSIVALIAPIGSAVAAWFAWRTARASEDVARTTLATAGADTVLRPTLKMSGHCGDSNDPLTLEATVVNQGRLAATVNSITVYLRLDNGTEPVGSDKGLQITTLLGQHATPVVIEAQNNVVVPVHVDCRALALNRSQMPGDTPELALGNLINTSPGRVVIETDDPLRGDQYLSDISVVGK